MIIKINLSNLIAALLLTAAISMNGNPVSAASADYTIMDGYHSNMDYFREMVNCAKDGSEYALQSGEVYEKQRNLKIDGLKLDCAKTDYFITYSTGAEILSAMKTDKMKAEHEAAGEVYGYLRKQEYSNAVIAGILGNMMAECGGQTLDLQWRLYGGGGRYYGLCQWNLYYCPDANGLDVTGQLDYLMDTIEENMTRFGGDYKYFCGLEDAGEAAKYFANYYERGSGIRRRTQNAYAALAWIDEKDWS